MKIPKTFRKENLEEKTKQLLEEANIPKESIEEYTTEKEFREFIYRDKPTIILARYDEIFEIIIKYTKSKKITWKKTREGKESSTYESEIILENKEYEKLRVPLSIDFNYNQYGQTEVYLRVAHDGPVRNHWNVKISPFAEECFKEEYDKAKKLNKDLLENLKWLSSKQSDTK